MFGGGRGGMVEWASYKFAIRNWLAASPRKMSRIRQSAHHASIMHILGPKAWQQTRSRFRQDSPRCLLRRAWAENAVITRPFRMMDYFWKTIKLNYPFELCSSHCMPAFHRTRQFSYVAPRFRGYTMVASPYRRTFTFRHYKLCSKKISNHSRGFSAQFL